MKKLETLLNDEIKRKKRIYQLIKKLDSTIDGEPVSFNDEEYNELSRIVKDEDFSDEDRTRLNFITDVLLPNYISLDKNQKSLLTRIGQYVKADEKPEDLKNEIDKMTEILDSLNSNQSIKLESLWALLKKLDVNNQDALELISNIVNYEKRTKRGHYK